MQFTLTALVRQELPRIKNSRFLATAAPARDEDEALALVRGVEAEFADARHHCFAFRLGPRGERIRFHDAGEPSGSAGRPILQQLETRALTQICVVVTRWFGGVKLGMGGLVRAYGGAASAALDRGTRIAVRTMVQRTLRHPYAAHAVVEQMLEATGASVLESCFDQDVWLRVELPEEEVEGLVARYLDLTAGRGEVGGG